MKAKRKRSGIHFAISNMAMLNTKTAWLAATPIEYWMRLAKLCGARIEWFPLSWKAVPTIQLATGLVNRPLLREGISSFHQSYLYETSLPWALESHQKNKAALPSYLALQHRFVSMRSIIEMQRRYFKNKLPVVHYFPEKFQFSSFPQRVQIIQQILDEEDITSVFELKVWARKKGVRFVYDTNHSRNLSLGDWRTVIHDAIDMIEEIHIRTGAYVAGKTDEQLMTSRDETFDIFRGVFASELTHILQLFKQLNWHGLVTIEVPTEELLTVSGEKATVITPERFVDLHSAFIRQIRVALT